MAGRTRVAQKEMTRTSRSSKGRTSRDINVPSRSACEVAYATIKSDILAFRLKPLDALSEAHLAQQLGMSRTPIREAIRKLEQEGLIWFARHKGAFVSPISLDDVLEIYLLREILEGAAAGLAAQRIDLAQVESLMDKLRLVDASDSEVDIKQMTELDSSVHAAILRAAGQTRLSSFVKALNEQAIRMRYIGIFARPRGNRDELIAVVKALHKRDSAGAEAAMRTHIRIARENIATFYRHGKDSAL
jgi:DNA-binding GntR family transcriptional regulator